ncbi:flagellar hook-associated protein FlgK [Treponema phagedenis]|uniref:flagellar hook-associated protein FlgK n=1 Tax=Treponema phagedenis TaxID=162 RepID=UPI00197FA5F0|nr:flagellar hook-associated protein FlgK [Treponema phagedenis]QSH94509.1 flagellar hook-associated protein FlgK [Treponema phagedenis]
MSTFASIELGKRSLFAHKQSVQTAGHNVANSSTPGYTRQRVNLDAFEPLYRPDLSRAETPGQIGQGVTIGSIVRLRDELLDQRIVGQSYDYGYWNTRDPYVQLLEQVYNEPDTTSVRTRMDQFWDSWQELSVYPESAAARQAVITRGQTLTDAIHHQYRGLKGIQDMVNGDIEATVKQINDLTAKIAALNEEIVKSKAMGDNPNDLMDKRDVYVEKLANLIDISVDKWDIDETYVIHTAGLELVQGKTHKTFGLVSGTENDGYANVIWDDSKERAHFASGKLASLIELRDGDIRDEIRKLDTMTMNFVDLVNDVHKNAMGLNGKTGIDFFKEQYFINNIDGNFDRNGDGEYDSSYIFRITGAHPLDPRQQIGLEGSITLSAADGTVEVPYYLTDMVSDLVARINQANAEVVAYLDQNNQLVLKGTTSANPDNPDFVIRYVEDSGRFLAGYAGVLAQSGAAGAYNWEQANAIAALAPEGAQHAVSPIAHPSGWMEINPEVKTDIQNIAAGYPGPEGVPYAGDNRAALAVAKLRNSPVMVGDKRTFDDFFAEAVTAIGLKGEQSQLALETQTAILKELTDMRDAVSGVNIDEELSDIIKFQHGYNASARFIATVNEMLDTIINRMGV